MDWSEELYGLIEQALTENRKLAATLANLQAKLSEEGAKYAYMDVAYLFRSCGEIETHLKRLNKYEVFMLNSKAKSDERKETKET